MRKRNFAFLLFGFLACLLCSFAWGDNAAEGWRDAVTVDGVRGRSTSVNNDGSGGGIATTATCTLNTLGEKCSKPGVLVGKCVKIHVQKTGKDEPSCVARQCSDGYLLELYSNGKSKGICRMMQFAQEQCKSVLKKRGETCSDGQEAMPKLVVNPNNSSDTRAYNECFCANKNMVIYQCGNDARGTPPKDSNTYTNVEGVVLKENTCTKSGATFVNWKCGDGNYQPGDIINIKNGINCVAQWSTNEYAVNYKCGDGASGSVPAQKVPYNTSVELPGYNAGCSKEKSTFAGWVCDGQRVNETITVTEDTTCIAQWENCDECNPGEGCTCDINVKDNQCTYITGTDTNYVMLSRENTNEPQCILAGEKECTDSGGVWKDGSCKCDPDIPETHWDITNKKCVCDKAGKKIEEGRCETPTTCPDSATGTHPNCTCTDSDKHYVESSNTCECPSDMQEDEKGGCIELEKCPADAVGGYPDCKCNDTDKKYNQNSNMCECPSNKPADANGKCVAPKACPADAVGGYPNCKCNDEDKKYDVQKNECVEDELKKKQKAYDDAKAKEQSFANRSLTAATTAATGIGGMELAQGLAEQSADRKAAEAMADYITTMRCEYANGKSVKAGRTEIELPGGNNQNLIDLRTEYFGLASDLKARKEALGMKPGIESEEILDNRNLGLYDDENTGITSGTMASLYRAQMLESKEDKAKLDEASATSQKRVKAGAIAAGAGVVGGLVGDSLINGELGQKLKEKKIGKETSALLEQESDALEELKSCLKKAGFQKTDSLSFENFYPSVLSVKNIDCKKDLSDSKRAAKKLTAFELFLDSSDATEIFNHLSDNFEMTTVGKLIGYPLKNDSDNVTKNKAINHLSSSIRYVQKRFDEAKSKDKESASKLGIDFGNISELVTGNGLKDKISWLGEVMGENSLSDYSSILEQFKLSK